MATPTPRRRPAPEPERFTHTDALYFYCVSYYRERRHLLSGPTQAVDELWPQLQEHIDPTLLLDMARQFLAKEVGRWARDGLATPPPPTHGLMTLEPFLLPGEEAGEPFMIPVTRLPQPGPQTFYPVVLENSVYTTATGSRSLLEFTIEDFQYCLDRMSDHRDGLNRRMTAMQKGQQLLRQRQVATVKELPQRDREVFAEAWQEAVRR
jgi:hypothetical protein